MITAAPEPTASQAPTLTAPAFLHWLKLRHHLRPLLHEAVAESLLLEAARAAGLAVSAAELQAAANAFRREHGLTGADRTRAWLAREGLTAADFEDALERDLLAEKFKDRLAAEQAAEHFEANRDRYARDRLSHLVTAGEGHARELLAQLHEEGADFADLARAHSLDLASARDGGGLGVVFHCRLPAAFADAVFAARPGDVVGPLQGPHGFHLVRVEELLPAELDDDTAGLIRQELFDAWLREKLAGARVELGWLEGMGGSV